MALTTEVFSVAISGTPSLNSPTSFDGRCAWFTTGTSNMSIHIIEYWGPYVDEDNDIYKRWAEIAVDDLTIGALGPKLKLKTTINTTKVIIQFTRNEAGVTTAICSDKTQIRISEVDYSILSSVIVNKPSPAVPALPTLFSGPFLDENGVAFTPSSEWIIKSSVIRNYQETPNFYYAVKPAPTTQTDPDTQALYWYDLISGLYMGHTHIPGRKQLTTRHLAYADGKVFVGAFNDGGVHVFNSIDGSYNTKLIVNRDVDEIFVYENTVYVSSRSGLFTKINPVTLSVSDYGNSSTRAYFIGLLDASLSAPTAISDAEFWGISQDCVGKYDGGSTVWYLETTFGITNAKYFNKLTRSGKIFNLYGEYKSAVYVPELKYQYWVDGALTDVTVPPHLLYSEANKVNAIRFPGIYKGSFSKSIGGVMAISSGPLHYKGDAI